MTKRRKSALMGAMVIGLAAMVGCGGKVEEANEDPPDPAEAPTAAEAGYPKLNRSSLAENGLEVANSLGPVLGGAESLEFVDRFFAELDWGKADLQPKIEIELNDAESLDIRLSPQATADRIEYVAVWRRPGAKIGGATSAVVKQSKRIDSAEQAIGLLRTYITENGEVESLVEWKD
ncbi:MAG: hypothetical protein ACR2RV_23780 [Verrucomicrobiales bacterium]